MCGYSSQPRNSVSLVCIASKAWFHGLPVAGEVCGGLAGEFRLPLLVARGERGACDPATDVAYCAKEVRLLCSSAGGGDLTRPSAQHAGMLAISIGRCRALVPTGQLELRDRLRHKGHEELYLTIPSYALHVLKYCFVQGCPLYHAVSLLQHFLSLPASKFCLFSQIVASKIIKNRTTGVTL